LQQFKSKTCKHYLIFIILIRTPHNVKLPSDRYQWTLINPELGTISNNGILKCTNQEGSSEILVKDTCNILLYSLMLPETVDNTFSTVFNIVHPHSIEI